MKALVVRQPWAGLIASGLKTLEVRSWQTRYRGELVIVAAKARDRMGAAGDCPPELLDVLGRPIALVELTACRYGRPLDYPAACIEFDLTHFVWKLDNVRILTNPPPIPGRLGLIPLSDETAATVRVAAGENDHGD